MTVRDRVERRARQVTARWRVLPDFLMVGAMKSGTSTLWKYLSGHPDTKLPSPKEVHYFSHEFHRGPTWYRSRFPVLRRGFDDARPWLVGEASTSYLFDPYAPGRAVQLLPRARLIAVLRHPTDRAYSHYQHALARGWENLSFSAALDREQQRLASYARARQLGDVDAARMYSRFAYFSRGLYWEQLQRWLLHYSSDQLLVLAAEDLFAEPQTVMPEVYEFLGLSAIAIEPRHRNARVYAPLDPVVRQRLNQQFQEPVRELETALGRQLPWEL